MKQLLIAALFIFAGTMSAQSLKEFSSAIEYNDYIVTQQTNIGAKITDFSNSFSVENATKENSVLCYNALIESINTAITNLKNLKTFNDKNNKGDFKLKEKALALFVFYKDYVQTVYSIALDEAYKAQPDMAKFDTLNKQYVEKEKTFDDEFKSAETTFAAAYNFMLE